MCCNSAWLLLLLCLLLPPLPTQAATPARFRVGVGQPYPTLEAARDAIRSQRQRGQLPGGAIVEISGTIYRDQPFILNTQDSGSPQAPIIYRSASSQPGRIIGGKAVDLSALASLADDPLRSRLSAAAQAQVQRVDLRRQGISDYGKLSERNSGYVQPAALEVVADQQPLTLARWPNQGSWATIAGPPREIRQGSFRYENERPERWASLDDVWVHGFFSYDYSDRYERITELNRTARTITTSAAKQSYATYQSGQRFAFVNLLEELDTPGEWYLDRQRGMLYLWPPSTTISELYVTLINEPLIQINKARNLQLVGLTIEGGRSVGIQIEGGSEILLNQLTIRNTGTDAVRLSGQRHEVRGCTITNTGDGGIRVSGGDRATLQGSGHLIRENQITHYARFVYTGRPAISLSGVGTIVRNNRIAEAPAAAIMFSGNNHLIERNQIDRVASQTADVGAIYTGRSWAGRGTIIQHNLISNLGADPPLTNPDGVQGIYLDDYAAGVTVQGNILVRAGDRGIFVNSGPDNQIIGNIIAGSRWGAYIQLRDWEPLPESILEELRQFKADQPPYATQYPALRGWQDLSAEQARIPRNTLIRQNVLIGLGEPIFLAARIPSGSVIQRENLIIPANDPAFQSFLRDPTRIPADPRLVAIAFPDIPTTEIGPPR
jgi:hypothetical protein